MGAIFTPIIYVGGKGWLSPTLANLCVLYDLRGMYDCFAGGGGAGATLLTKRIPVIFNELNPYIYNIHKQLLENPVLLSRWELNSYREIVDAAKQTENLSLQAYAHILIGQYSFRGMRERGSEIQYKKSLKTPDILGAMRNLPSNIKKWGELMRISQSSVAQQDALDIATAMRDGWLYYYDPPYMAKQYKKLYGEFDCFDHEALAERLQACPNLFWAVSYGGNDIDEARRLYAGRRIIVLERISNIKSCVSEELLIVSDAIKCQISLKTKKEQQQCALF